MNPRQPIKTGDCFLAWEIATDCILLCTAEKAYNHRERGRFIEAWVVNGNWKLTFLNGVRLKDNLVILPIRVENCLRHYNEIIWEAIDKLVMRGLI